MADVRVSWTWDGKDDVQKHLKKVEDALSPPGITESLSRGADTIVDAVREHTPVKTGALRNSIGKKPQGDLEFDISPYVNPTENDRGYSTVLYAEIQEAGGAIDAKDGYMGDGYMHFQWNGGWVRRKSVTLTGTHYMEDGFAEGAPQAARQVIEEVKKKIED